MAMAALPKAASGGRWRAIYPLPPGTWGRHLPPEVIVWSTEPLSLYLPAVSLDQNLARAGAILRSDITLVMENIHDARRTVITELEAAL